MVKMTIQHITVLNRAQVFLEPLVKKVQDEKMAARIQGDIERLNEIRLFLIDSICQPMLPFGMDEVKPRPESPGPEKP